MLRLLLVEDDELNRDMLSRRLGRNGYEVITAVDGEQALALAASQAPAAILMDMNLPRLDGWEAARRLKSADATCTIPIIGLTATATDADRARALAAGFGDYVEKPVIFEALLAKIKELLAAP